MKFHSIYSFSAVLGTEERAWQWRIRPKWVTSEMRGLLAAALWLPALEGGHDRGAVVSRLSAISQHAVQIRLYSD